jgi:HEAT repeat protein
MSRSLFPFPAALLVCAGLVLPLSAADSALPALGFSGSQAALETLDGDLKAAGTDPAKLAAIEARLLAVLRNKDATYAARQAAAQRLGLVLAFSAVKPTAATLRPLGTMLADERDSDLARSALEPVTSDVADPLLVTALGKTSGRTRLGLIDTVARRGSAAAVPALAKLLASPDAPTAAAAAEALGAIGGSEALAVLQATPEPAPRAVTAAKLVAVTRLPAAAAVSLLQGIRTAAGDPVHRAAALRALLEIDAVNAPATTVAVLGGDDWAMKQVVLESLYASRAPGLAAALLGSLPSWDAPTQSGVLHALGRRGEATAAAVAVAATAHADAEVRGAAITALGTIPGSAETARVLAKIVAGADAAEAKAARVSLARLNGPGVSAAVFSGAEQGEAALRTAFIEQLALRNQIEGLPLLLKLRADPDAAVRAAAASAFGDLAPITDVKILLDWTLAATDANEQSRALRALVTLTLRNPMIATRGAPVYAAIESASAEAALRLLPALGRIGGEPSAASAARLALGTDAKVAEAALAALTRWSDTTALASLAGVAATTALPAARTTAVEGVIAYFERTRVAWDGDDTAVVARLLPVVADPAVRGRLLKLLSRAGDATALALAAGLKADAAVGAAAREAVEIITANLAGPAKVRASAPSGAGNIMDGKTNTRWTVAQVGEEWVEIDFKVARPLHRLTLDQTGRTGDFPESYAVHVTDDLANPGAAVATGTGQTGKTVIALPSGTRGRYVIIKNVAERLDGWWAIIELYVD